MEKFAIDLDKVLDEFEFNEDRAEQMSTILSKKGSGAVPSVVGASPFQPSTCYSRPAFEPINLADADFAADPQTSTSHFNNGFASVSNATPSHPSDDRNDYLYCTENINKGNDIRLRNDTSFESYHSDMSWHQQVSSFHNHNRIDLSSLDQLNHLPAQSISYSDSIAFQRNVDHHSQNVGFDWQQDRSEISLTNKLNVSGVFSSLQEYLDTGNIEAKLTNVSIVNNQKSWNPVRKQFSESEENGNYALESTSMSEITSKKYEHDPSKLTSHFVNTDKQVSSCEEKSINMSQISEPITHNAFADLIPINYSKSLQEDIHLSGNLSNKDEHIASDETPDLLDTTMKSNKSSGFSHKLPDYQASVALYSNVDLDVSLPNIIRRSSFEFSKDNIQLPDVATSTTSDVTDLTSDLVTSHGSGSVDNGFERNLQKMEPNSVNRSILEVVSQGIEVSRIPIVNNKSTDAFTSENFENVYDNSSSKLLERQKINMSQGKRYTGQHAVEVLPNISLQNNSCSSNMSREETSSIQSNDIEINKTESTVTKPIGFNAEETWSDADLHEYLQELESGIWEPNTRQEFFVNEVNNETTSIFEKCTVDCPKELINGNISEVSKNEMEINTENKENILNNCFNESSDNVINTELQVSSSDMQQTELTSSLQNKIVEEKVKMDFNAPVTEEIKSSLNSLDSVYLSTSQNNSSVKTIQLASLSENVFSVSQSVPTLTNVSLMASKTPSVITNLVSIECQQIDNSTNPSKLEKSGKYSSNNMESHIKEENIVIPKFETVAETEFLDNLENVPDSENLENEVSSLKTDSVSNIQNSSSSHSNFECAESGPNKVISFYIDTCSFDKAPCEMENSVIQSLLIDNFSEKEKMSESSVLKYDISDNESRPILSEHGYSEVSSCLVRMPRDGSTINVLGEEERPSRPKYLFLPSKITVENKQEDSENSDESPPTSNTAGPPGETPSAEPTVNCTEATDNVPLSSPDVSETSSVEQALSPVLSLQITTPLSDDMSDILSPEERSLGKLPPFWVPDADAPNCMQCDIKFTVLKRRHHCRACGKVLCSKCCSLKSRLEYMDNSEARVCQPCFATLAKVCLVEQGESASGSLSSLNEGISNANTPLGRQPNPNNPMEYCSTIPPMEQAASVLRQPPPSVLVPVGVLKREGSTKTKSDVTKQVIFSDGIRPGGDLTELDGSSEPRLPYRRPGRILKRVGTPPGPPTSVSNHSSQKLLPPLDPKTMSYIPTDKGGLPPLAIFNKGEVKFEDVTDHDKEIAALRSDTESVVVFAINRNLFVHVKVLNLDCCVNRICWCFSTSGMSCVGQDEIVIILECLPDEMTIPKDIFQHLNSIYQDASRGNTLSELGHTVLKGTLFLGSHDYGGFIYIRPSFQCLQKLIIPSSPYLVGILVHRWEIPWATVFPIRLMLRLGAEYRYYPCMLVSIRNRRPVYWEIGHTIINLLADFRNLSYTLPPVRGMVIHMEDRQTSILLPKNRYDQVTRALNNSNDHVLALASNFSFVADSHLVCIQSNRDESYHTQAINIHNKPRKVTGASFVVFNGALKTSSNLTAKSSIVEDGLMVQITPDTMQALRGALRNMQNFSIGCGPSGASQPDELVNLKWVQDDKNFNVGVKSSIDGKPLDGIPSIRVHNGTDYMGSCRFIRWTEVFILQSDEDSGRGGDPVDISRLSESLARATCLALIKLLDLLAQAGLTKLAIRATVHPENVGYEAGSKGEKLPPIYMDSLDNELVPVLHKAASMSQDSSSAILELIFHIMLQ